MARAARRSGISFRTVRSIFYGQINDPKHPSVRLIRHAASERAKALAERYETLARSMDATDPDFYSADVLGLIDAARALRGLDRSGNDRPGEIEDEQQ